MLQCRFNIELIEHQHFPNCLASVMFVACGASVRSLQPQRSLTMFTKFLRPWRKVAIAAIVSAAGIATVSTAMAGECPADKIVADGKGQPMGATEPKDVTDTVLAAIDLSKENLKADGHQFRMRQLEIQ